MKATIVALILFASMLSCGLARAAEVAPKICVLNFERPEFPVSKYVKKLFAGHLEITIHTLALPIDFLNCIKDGSVEILFIGHALLTERSKDGKHPVELGYFRDLQGEERKDAVSSTVAYLDQQVSALQTQLKERWRNDQQSEFDDPDFEKLRKFISSKETYASFPDDKPYYVIRPFLPQAMTVARAELTKEAAKGTLSLRKIRLMSCVPQQVLAEYDDLRALVEEHNITLDVAPTNPILSFFEGIPVTSVSPKWLRQSLPPKL